MILIMERTQVNQEQETLEYPIKDEIMYLQQQLAPKGEILWVEAQEIIQFSIMAIIPL